MLRTVPISGAGGAASGTATLSIAVTDGTNTVTPISLLQFNGGSVSGNATTATINIAVSPPVLASTMANGTINTGTAYWAIGFNTASTEVARQVPLVRDGILSGLGIYVNNQIPATSSVIVTARLNGATSALRILIPAGSAAGYYSNTSTSVTVTAGTLYSTEIINSGGAISGAGHGFIFT